MGFSFLSKRGCGDGGNPNRLKKRKHRLALRHEANTVELFFDLFFVANLATFTAYHSITDSHALYAYIGFFAIIWSTWFQITLHDVRFARDCVYEWFCKTIQMIVFVGFALVGSAFSPGTKKGNNTNFRILCYTLFLSRGLFTLQYCVVLGGSLVRGYKKLVLPLLLNIALNAAAAAAFAAMTPAFSPEDTTSAGIYGVRWIIMLIEAAGTIAISSYWRMLSFKKTLIVIGEGAIGVTKTIARMMGKYGLDPEGTILIVMIILVLVFLWMLYFDNHPHNHYGTIRQQFWSALHFPFHLAIVGVVEGSQQIALARYVLKGLAKFVTDIEKYCTHQQLEGMELITKLNASVDYFQLDKKVESVIQWGNTQLDLLALAQAGPGLCSPEYTSQFGPTNPKWPFRYPPEFENLTMHIYGGIYASLGIKLDWQTKVAAVALSPFRTTYIYYWSAMLVLLACMMAFLYLVRRNRKDVFDWVAQITRALLFGLVAVLLIIARSDTVLYRLLGEPGLVPLMAVMLFVLVLTNRMAKAFANWRLQRSGADFVEEDEEEDHHAGHHQLHEHPGGHDEGHADEESKQHAFVSVQEMTPFEAHTEYDPVPHSASFGAPSPPTPGLQFHSPPPLQEMHGGGYVPVSNGRYGQ